MNISAHLLVAVALVATLLIVVLAEATLRRRVRRFRTLQLFVICSALLLVPANIVSSLGAEPWIWHVVALVGGFSAVVAQAAIVVLAWVPVEKVDRPRRVLAIGAHPDDLELAAGGTLARLADAGHEIHALVMSDGSVGGNADARPGEAYAGAAFMRLTNCEVLGLPDTELASHDNDMVAAIEAKIVSLNPDLIFTHSSNDQHQDHEAVHWATMRAGRRHPAILCYESPSVTRDFSPQVFVDIENYLDAKSAAVAIHHDQADKPYMSEQSLAGIATFRGAQGKLRMAEGFEAVRINGFAGVL
ncbi:MAG: PIG-L deacetylase family protein [Propionibacteriaceae bacterium]|nr:PIG-L deacetylase family protein [Propionibacteriaceae bacterium]